MRNINGTNYMSAKEYAALKNVTIGRISQIKSDLPFEKMEDLGVELINFDLLQLEEKEVIHAQTKFQTTHPLHTYTYKQMGMFVADMVKTGNDARANAETLMIEKDAILEERNNQVSDLQETNKELNRILKETQQENNDLSINLQTTIEEVKTVNQALASQKEVCRALEIEKQTHLKTIESLNTIQQKQQSDFEIKVIENQGLVKENSIHIIQNENLTTEISREKQLVEKLRMDLKEATSQKEALSKENAIIRLSEQKAIYEKELKMEEIKSLQKENILFQKQIETLTKNIENGSGFNKRLDKLEGMLLNSSPEKILDNTEKKGKKRNENLPI